MTGTSEFLRATLSSSVPGPLSPWTIRCVCFPQVWPMSFCWYIVCIQFVLVRSQFFRCSMDFLPHSCWWRYRFFPTGCYLTSLLVSNLGTPSFVTMKSWERATFHMKVSPRPWRTSWPNGLSVAFGIWRWNVDTVHHPTGHFDTEHTWKIMKTCMFFWYHWMERLKNNISRLSAMQCSKCSRGMVIHTMPWSTQHLFVSSWCCSFRQRFCGSKISPIWKPYEPRFF